MQSWAEAQGIQGDLPQLCADPGVKEQVLKDLTATGKAEKLKGFELIKAVHLVPEWVWLPGAFGWVAGGLWYSPRSHRLNGCAHAQA